jgi:hypothetical protein
LAEREKRVPSAGRKVHCNVVTIFNYLSLRKSIFFLCKSENQAQKQIFNAEQDLRLHLSSVVPDYQALCWWKQAHPSHWNLRSRLLQATTDLLVICNWSYKLMHEKNATSQNV